MIALSEDIVERIAEDLRVKGIETQDLQDNLLDHICCILEQELRDLKEFDQKYPEILRRFYKHNLSELEEETQQLLTFKNYYAMKKTMLLSGGITSFAFIIGAFLKYFHLPGAGIILVLGIVFFSFLFLPLMITLKLKESNGNKDKVILFIGLITGILASMGVLFKLMWWPGANILWKLSLFSLLLVYLPAYFFSNFRNPLIKVNTMVTTILLLAGGGMLFALTAFSNSNSTTDAVDTMLSSTETILHRLHDKNNSLLSIVEHPAPGAENKSTANEVELETTNSMVNDLQNFKAGLISKTENLPIENAKKISVMDLPVSKNYQLVKSYLQNDPEVSLKSLIDKINTYNQSLSSKPGLSTLLISDATFSNTQLRFVVHNLNLLEYQAEINRQVILNYELGKTESH